MTTALTLLLSPVLTLYGCGEEPTCEQLDCRPGLECNAEGECVPVETNCTEADCPSGEVCDPESGECRPRTPTCPAQPCPRGYVCNTSTESDEKSGVCEPASDCTRDGCRSPVEVCDPTTDSCVLKSCSDDGDCPAPGWICGREDTCVAGCRPDRGNCPTGETCESRPQSSASVGTCRRNCNTDQDCPIGQECPDDGSICRPEGPCDSDDDCRTDEVCRGDVCTTPPCSENTDCPSKQVCDTATGVCVGGSCTEDSLSPNHRPSAAASVRFETFESLRLCPGRSDWFALDVDSAEAVRLRLEHDVDRDADLTVYGERGRILAENGQAPPSDSSSGRFVSSARFISPRKQTVQIHVYSPSRHSAGDDGGNATPLSVRYDLRVGPARNLSCADDGFEENDSRTGAAEIPSNVGAESTFELQICGPDRDWFALTDVRARSQIQTRLVGVDGDDDHLRLEVLSENGARYVLRPSEALKLLRTGANQDWFFRVYSTTGRSASYGIRYQVEGPYDCPQAGEHDSVSSALSLNPQTRTTFHLCPLERDWEIDWISLTPPPSSQTLDVTVENLNPRALDRLDVSLYENQMRGVERIRRAVRRGNRLEMQARVDSNQEMLLYLESEGRPGPVESPPTYRVNYRYRSK